MSKAEQISLAPENSSESKERYLTQQELAQLALRLREADKQAAPDKAREIAFEMNQTQNSFAKQLQRISERGEKRISKAEFEKWEDDYEYDWNRLKKELEVGEIYSAEAEADVESPLLGIIKEKLTNTIEAQAGNFYDERYQSLMNAIRESDSPSKEKDIEYLHNFRHLVMSHIDYKYIDKYNTAENYDSYDSLRNDNLRVNAHNNVIRHLNGMNDLAKKYHTRKFTPRNFWTSNGTKETPNVKARILNDRHIVEAYYSIAFSYEIRDYERKMNRGVDS